MSRDIAVGDTQTIESQTTAYGTPLNVGGEMNVGGEVLLTDVATTSASGTADTTGSATETRERTKDTASGEADFDGLSLPRLDITPSSTETIATGTTDAYTSVRLGGELNVGGELRLGEGQTKATRERIKDTASGTGDTTGAAIATRERIKDTASGEADFSGTAVFTLSTPLIRRDTANIDFDVTEEYDLDTDDLGIQ